LRPLKAHSADLAAVVILLLILTALFSDVLFFGSNFHVRDVPLQYYPSRRVLHDVVAAGHFPFWNPRISAGQPLAANPAYETFYPFQWLIFLPYFDLGFRLTIVLHFYLAAIGRYLLLRSLGTRIWAALFGALTFALGGMFVLLASLLAFLFSAAWLPWIAFFWRRANVTLTALSLGMLLLAADQSMILQAGALVVAYGAYRKIGVRSLAIVLIAAFLVGAVQLIPALDLQAESGRSQPLPYETAAASSLRPYRLLELTFPNLDAWHSKDLTLIWSRRSQGEFAAPLVFSFYPGLLAGVLIVAGMICRTRGWMFVAAWSAASYLLALGRYAPFFRILYAAGIRSIRYPEKFFVSAIFVLSIFAALAFDDLDRNARLRRTVLAVVAIIAAIRCALPVCAFRGLRPSFRGGVESIQPALHHSVETRVAPLSRDKRRSSPARSPPTSSRKSRFRTSGRFRARRPRLENQRTRPAHRARLLRSAARRPDARAREASDPDLQQRGRSAAARSDA